jgi:hypothetical protein
MFSMTHAMRNTRKIIFVSICSILINAPAFSQIFTRVTDPTNPIVTDGSESGGGSWIDVNNDGWLDLLVSNGNLLERDEHLYLNLGGSGFVKVTTGAIVNNGGSSIGSTWADMDEDGSLDCFVTNRNNFGNFLYLGIGDTLFTQVIAGEVVTDIANSNSSSWLDIDNDGDLDLYVVNFSQSDLLYLNSGSPSYELSPASPVSSTTDFSISGAWADMNNDLLPDLFICNSGTSSDDLYKNNGDLSFTHTVIEDGRATMGASWGDFNNDGYLDLYAASFLQHGNILYQNTGAPDFHLAPLLGTIPEVMGNCVGSVWGDVDNDGDLDLYVGDDGGNNHLFINSGPPSYTFTENFTDGSVLDGGQTFGCSMADYDNDGQLDLFVANRLDEENFLYHNNGNSNHWVTIKCVDEASNRSAIGTKVKVKANINGNMITQTQEVLGQTGYNSQNLWLHFGLGDAAMIDTLLLIWPSGFVDTCTSVPADAQLLAQEGACVTLSTHEEVTRNGLQASLYPNPATSRFNLTFTQIGSGPISIVITDVTGRVVKRQTHTTDRLSGTVEISVAELPTGHYNCTISIDGHQKSLPFQRIQ